MTITINDRAPISPICSECRHLTDRINQSCPAFDYIPDDIWYGRDDHARKHPGQQGNLTFEQREKSLG